MPEYIEREALLKRNMYGNTNPITHRTYAENLIKSAPTADVVEVVRCKDCIQRRYHCFGQYYCQRYLFKCKDNDFCSYGKRKEGAEE